MFAIWELGVLGGISSQLCLPRSLLEISSLLKSSVKISKSPRTLSFFYSSSLFLFSDAKKINPTNK
jgi:hypothetical protein